MRCVNNTTEQWDAMDQLLFDTANEYNDHMSLDAAWLQTLAAHAKKSSKNRRRRTRVALCGSLAAALVVGLYLGAATFKRGFSLPFFHPYEIVVDPPKTDGGVSAIVREETWSALCVFPNIIGGEHIDDLLPAWVPEDFGPVDTFHYEEPARWACASLNPDSNAWADGSLMYMTDEEIPEGLEIGHGKALIVELDYGEFTESWMTFYARTSETRCLRVDFFNVSYEDALKMLQSIHA